MQTGQAGLLAIIIGLTVLSGIGDSQGFIYASRIWQDGRLAGAELAKSALGFAFGITMYWIVLRYMARLGIVAPEVQTVIWFTVTIVGVALISGKFLQWRPAEQAVAVAVLAGTAWLMFRTGG